MLPTIQNVTKIPKKTPQIKDISIISTEKSLKSSIDYAI